MKVRSTRRCTGWRTPAAGSSWADAQGRKRRVYALDRERAAALAAERIAWLRFAGMRAVLGGEPGDRDRDPIQQYLDQPPAEPGIPEVGRILVEAEDHLSAATAAGMAEGLTERAAQQAAITGFGGAAIVYAHQTRHGRVAACSLTWPSRWRWPHLPARGLPTGPCRAPQARFRVPRPRTSCKLFTLVPRPAPSQHSSPGPLRGSRPWPCWRRTLPSAGSSGAAGRVWSVPLGGYFPLAAVVASVAAGVGLLLLDTTATSCSRVRHHHLRGGGPRGHLWMRTWRMLWNQARGRDELDDSRNTGPAVPLPPVRPQAPKQLQAGSSPGMSGIIMDGNSALGSPAGMADPASATSTARISRERAELVREDRDQARHRVRVLHREPRPPL